MKLAMLHQRLRARALPILYGQRRLHRLGWRPENLRVAGLAPATVVDIGVGYGTPSLYRAFPNAYLVMIEPLREFEPVLKRLAHQHGGEYHLTAVGAEDGTVTINVDPDVLMKSSVLDRSALTAGKATVAPRKVPLTSVDRLWQLREWPGPFGIKIDTEGFEMAVLQGAREFLQQTHFVIAEVSVAARFEGGYEFADLIALLRDHDLHLMDILNAPRNDHGRLLFVDAMFTRSA